MIDLNILEQYKENNRIEAKKALGGLPHSIWETYSAFANTLGGVILLGVEEYRDKSFHTVDLPDPEGMREEFLAAVSDPSVASVNILSPKDVRIETVSGKRIIVISVPEAGRSYKPVYVEGNPLHTYRRDGEGDHRCTPEEYQAMLRDASALTPDMQILEGSDIAVFNTESLNRYRQRMMVSHPENVLNDLSDTDFLPGIGAARIGDDGKLHPTAGGLLMFGNREEIIRVFPEYYLAFSEMRSGSGREKARIVSDSGGWSGNVLDFYFRVCGQLRLDLKTYFIRQKELKNAADPVYSAVREALVNCIVNADYYGSGGITVVMENEAVSISNPGRFRIGVTAAKSGGLSDPRNSAVMKMLNLIDIGTRTGSGIPHIFRIWKEQNLKEPEIRQTFDPDRITLTLPLYPEDGERLPASAGVGNISAGKAIISRMIIDYLTLHIEASSADLSAYLSMDQSAVRRYLRGLISGGIVTAVGNTRARVYKLKS